MMPRHHGARRSINNNNNSSSSKEDLISHHTGSHVCTQLRHRKKGGASERASSLRDNLAKITEDAAHDGLRLLLTAHRLHHNGADVRFGW